jgi:creatinine amidohydrolase
MKKIYLEEMNWPDVKEAIANGYKQVIIGIGSTEQHGPHLPLKTDAALANEIVPRVAKGLGNTLIAPTIQVGCSEHHLAFPGTISIQSSTLQAIIFDYVESLRKHGFKTAVFISTHGGNFSTLQEAIEKLENKFSDFKTVGYTNLFAFMEPLYQVAKEHQIPIDEGGAHAGEIETSMMMAIHPNSVMKDRFEPGYVGPLGSDELNVILKNGMPALTKNGILGDPAKSTSERGQKYIEKLTNFLVSEIKRQL